MSAQVARESVLKFNPSANITAYHGNIKDERFGAAFFGARARCRRVVCVPLILGGFAEQFDLVLNALDNVAARRHVNRLCLALGIPLVESGTQVGDAPFARPSRRVLIAARLPPPPGLQGADHRDSQGSYGLFRMREDGRVVPGFRPGGPTRPLTDGSPRCRKRLKRSPSARFGTRPISRFTVSCGQSTCWPCCSGRRTRATTS